MKKQENAITLIALAITIIVLLILAGIAISSITSEEGILNKTQTAAEQHEIKQYEEDLTLKLSDAKIETIDNKEKTILEIIKEKINSDDKYEIIEEAEGSITVTTKSGGYTYIITENGVETIGKGYIITYDYAGAEGEENPTSYTEGTETFTLKNPTRSGYIFVGWTGTGLEEATTTVTIEKGSTGNRNYVAEWESAIKYPSGKTIETVAVNEDITIGTERFKVLKKTDTTITAMPYYNITLTTNNPVQSRSAGTTSFASSMYWASWSSINMDDSRNYIQKYITAYQTTLRNLGATNVTTRVARFEELNGWTQQQRNPGQTGYYWVGTSCNNSWYEVYTMTNIGFLNPYGQRKPLCE